MTDTVTDAASFAEATRATPAQMADMQAYLDLLTEWNSVMNLVGPSALEVFWGRHAYDSAQLLDFAPDALVWADLGAGAGFPGLVLAIMLKGRDGAKVHLVEATGKRCRFLQAVIDQLKLPAAVINARAEDGGLAVDIVTARACAPMTRLLRYAKPWLAKGGMGLFLKGGNVEEELEAAAREWRFPAEILPSLSDPSGRVVVIDKAPKERHVRR